ncbi:MAG: hypothetical protein EOP09_00250 [Proteobacteria bacterium]|nr:MAG: hypothetical protein EOP09_00250 [Pseudomonadota bacterium]
MNNDECPYRKGSPAAKNWERNQAILYNSRMSEILSNYTVVTLQRIDALAFDILQEVGIEVVLSAKSSEYLNSKARDL